MMPEMISRAPSTLSVFNNLMSKHGSQRSFDINHHSKNSSNSRINNLNDNKNPYFYSKKESNAYEGCSDKSKIII